MNEAKMTELTQAEEMAFFRADLCLYSPESYTLEEKKEICNDMFKTNRAIQDAMRADFEQLPPNARAKVLDMLCASGVESPQWWWAKETRSTGSSSRCCNPSPYSKQGGRLSRRKAASRMLFALGRALATLERLEHRHQRQEQRHHRQTGHVTEEPADLVGQELQPPPHDSLSFTRLCAAEYLSPRRSFRSSSLPNSPAITRRAMASTS